MYLKLTNNLTKIDYTFTGLTDNLESRLFYAFNLSLQEGMADGEYTYTLFDDDDQVKATGLCQIGDYKPEEKHEYKKDNNGYIQYNG